MSRAPEAGGESRPPGQRGTPHDAAGSHGAQASSGPASIAEVIEAAGGCVTFARFMEIALTHPILGYYSRVDRLLSHGGDFSTAPALSPFFNRTVARLVTELVDAALAAPAGGAPADAQTAAPAAATPTFPEVAPGAARPGRPAPAAAKPVVVELGGGEGHLAEGILRYWATERLELRERVGYRIVEVGAHLREQQAAALDGLMAAGWEVGWGADLEEACSGTRPVVVVGNEFLDTVPVHLVDVREATLREMYVTVERSDFLETWGDLSDEAENEIGFLFGTLDPKHLAALTQDGVLEVFPGLGDLMREVAGLMPWGSLVNIDYGEWFAGLRPADERWGVQGRAQRRRTLRGYLKHQMVVDPLVRAGRQDLTADVDFAALDLHGRRERFETVLFTTLGRFLRGGGADEELQALRASDGPPSTARPVPDRLEADRQATVLRNLMDEDDVGSAFKVMVQVRG